MQWLMTLAFAMAAPQFERDVYPLLAKRCLGCHTGAAAQAGLDLGSRSSALKGGRSGAAVIPGIAAKSRLYLRIRDGQMPPAGDRLTSDEVERIRAWIDAGAGGNDAAPAAHWAFKPPARPPVPKVRERDRVRTPVDSFVLAELEKQGLSLSPEADRAVLIRRLSFDLIGLPPSPEEVADFVREGDYNKVVERLLSSPRYGERWGRHWLDAAGYADSEGVLAADVVRPNAWRYRDYVIRAFNNDKPYDQFVREQLAGDEISEYFLKDPYGPDVVARLEATGFLRTAVDATREDFKPRDFAEYHWRTFFDTQQIAVSALMGLTIQCARCHDHKYEPFTQRDYYSLQAVFAGALRPNGPVLPSASRRIIDAPRDQREAAEKNNAPLDQVIKAARELQTARIAQYRALHPKGDKATEKELREAFPDFAKKADALKEELKQAESKRIDLPTIRALYDQDSDAPATHILLRGDPLSPGDAVAPGVPAVIDDGEFRVPVRAADAKTTGRRKAFAEWLTRKENPLTARVMVNRIWAGHFGVGIVAALDNFGKSGPPPSHPELLDWLASEFVSSGWSIKDMHRLITQSSVYRQASARRVEASAKDPGNRLLWRVAPRRLEAEVIRDSVLYVAGKLDERMFGAPVNGETKDSGEVAPAGEKAEGRRSIYQMVRRSAPQNFLNAFDAPVMEINCVRRVVSTSATQALAMMNGDFVTAQAGHFAGRVLRETAGDDRVIAERVFRLALGRPPSAGEMDSMLSFLSTQGRHYPPDEQRKRVIADLCQVLLGANEFVYVD